MADEMTSGASAENKAIVARFFETFSSGDVPALLDAMADAGSWWVSGRLEGMSICDSATRARSEASAPFSFETGQGAKSWASARARRLISALSPKQRQMMSGFKPMKE